MAMNRDCGFHSANRGGPRRWGKGLELTGKEVAGLPVGRPVDPQVLRLQRALRDPLPQLGQTLLPLHQDVVQLLAALIGV